MVLIDVHRRNLRKRKRERQSKKEAAELNSLNKAATLGGINVATQDFERKNSFSDQDDILPPVSLLSHQRSFVYDDMIDLKKPELTIYSEEGIADMDLPDNLLMMEDLEYLDNITSCNKVENCLMLSEYEQNLIKETESPNSHRRSRKWSLFKQPTLQTINSESEDVDNICVDHRTSVLDHRTTGVFDRKEMVPLYSKSSSFRKFSQEPKRSCMDVIEEASV